MKQSSFDDDELFGEAAEDLRGDIETALGDAKAALPAPDAVWDAEGDNVLGVLNALRGEMETEGAREHLREARKWLTMADRADAFEDESVEADVEAVERILADLEDSRERISGLAGTIPELRSDLEALHAGDPATGDGAETGAGEDDGAETEADGGEPADTAGEGGGESAEVDDASEEEADDGVEQQATLDGE